MYKGIKLCADMEGFAYFHAESVKARLDELEKRKNSLEKICDKVGIDYEKIEERIRKKPDSNRFLDKSPIKEKERRGLNDN